MSMGHAAVRAGCRPTTKRGIFRDIVLRHSLVRRTVSRAADAERTFLANAELRCHGSAGHPVHASQEGACWTLKEHAIWPWPVLLETPLKPGRRHVPEDRKLILLRIRKNEIPRTARTQHR